MKITTKHVSNSPVTFVTDERFAALFFLPSCCVNSLLALSTDGFHAISVHLAKVSSITSPLALAVNKFPLFMF